MFDEFYRPRIEKLRADPPRPGDFVSLAWRYPDVWQEVISVYCHDDNDGRVVLHRHTAHGGSDYLPWKEINLLHRKEDPWDYKEVRCMDCSLGQFGEKMAPLPQLFRYQGTFSIEAWLWNYCGRNVEPRNKLGLKPFAELAEVPMTGIDCNSVWSVIEKLQQRRIKGWHPICKPVPEQRFGKTISFPLRQD